MWASFLPPWVMFQPNRRLLNINRVMAWNIMRRSPRLALLMYGCSELGGRGRQLVYQCYESVIKNIDLDLLSTAAGNAIHLEIIIKYLHISTYWPPWVPAPLLNITSRPHRCWWRGLWQHVQYWIRLETYVLITQYVICVKRCVDSTGRTGDKNVNIWYNKPLGKETRQKDRQSQTEWKEAGL